VMGIALLGACLIFSFGRRRWWLAGAGTAMLLVTWDTLINSILYFLGVQAPSLASLIPTGSSAAAGGAGPSGDAPVSATAATEAVQGIADGVFSSPGGVEQIQPILACLTLAAFVMTAWLLCISRPGKIASRMPIGRQGLRVVAQHLRPFAPVGPIIAFGGYVLLIQVADAVATGGAPHYGGHKLTFALCMMALATTLPVAIAGLDGAAPGMTPVRWCAAGGVVLALSADTILPRAVSALSPELWRAPSAGSAPYWWPAEVKATPDQPISSLPIACFFAPPTTQLPSALPEGQRSYACSRLLIGLAALEGDPTGTLINWLRSDWGSNQPQWDVVHGALGVLPPQVLTRKVILMTPEGGVAGLSTLRSLLDQYPPGTQ
jgi:hypothetical protein